MKILHLTVNFYPVTGGIETFVYEISKRLVKSDNEVFIITSDKLPHTKKVLPRREDMEGIKVLRVPFHTVFRYNFSLKALRLIFAIDWDVLHIHGLGFFNDLLPVLKILRKKRVFLSTHGGIFHTPHANILKKIYFNTIARFNLKFVNRVIAHSLHDKELFSKICDPKKISLIHYGIDWKKLRRTKRKSDGKTLVYIGRLAKNKRLERMIYVLYYLRKKISDVRLLLVGEDWGEKKKLIRIAKQLDVLENVKFIDPVPHIKVADYLSVSDIFLLSSDYEGFGISVIEAMACGLPVVVNNIPPMREIIENGKSGYIVDFDEYQKVAKLIYRLLKNEKKREEISKNAIIASKKYDWSIISKEVNIVYRSV